MNYVLVKKYGVNSFGIPELWPVKIKKVSVNQLTEDYDYISTEADYNAFITANQVNFEAGKLDIVAANQAAAGANKFRQVREKWQSMADAFAAENSSSGITTAQAKAVADSFDGVVKYLERNVPTQALAEVDLITPVEPFLTQAKIDSLKAELLAAIQQIFGI